MSDKQQAVSDFIAATLTMIEAAGGEHFPTFLGKQIEVLKAVITRMPDGAEKSKVLSNVECLEYVHRAIVEVAYTGETE